MIGNWRGILAGGLVIAAASGMVGFKIGHVFGFKSGHSAGVEAQTPKAIEEANKSSKSLEKEMKNAKNLSNDDVDSGLSALGIMRNDADR